jgi:hypothetical protein
MGMEEKLGWKAPLLLHTQEVIGSRHNGLLFFLSTRMCTRAPIRPHFRLRFAFVFR